MATPIETLTASAAAAVAISDWATALNDLEQLAVQMAGIPDSEQRGTELEWKSSRESVDRQIVSVRKNLQASQVSNAHGLIRTSVKCVPVTE